MIKKACTAALLILLSSCNGQSNFSKLVSGTAQKPSPAEANKPAISSTLPAPYSTFGPPKEGGGCGFEKPVIEGGNVGVAGWAFVEAKTGTMPEKVFLQIEGQDLLRYAIPASTVREDVATFFKNPNLKYSGFQQVIPIPQANRPATISVILAFDSKLFRCSNQLKVS